MSQPLQNIYWAIFLVKLHCRICKVFVVSYNTYISWLLPPWWSWVVPAYRKQKEKQLKLATKGQVSQKHVCYFVDLTIRTRPLDPVWPWWAVTVRSLLVGSGFLLRFGVWGQQSVSVVFVFLQQLQCLFLRQLHVLQLLQQITLLLWKTAAYW